MPSARVVVLASGTGTNLLALLEASGAFDATGETTRRFGGAVVAVGTDRPGAPALDHARRAGAETFAVPVGDYPDRDAWTVALRDAVAAHRPDLVVCAGFMRILGPAFVRAFAGRILNTHPSLLPAFPGAHAARDAIAHGVKLTGVTLHFVDEGLDSGPIVDQRPVPVEAGDTEGVLQDRIKEVEHRMLCENVGRLLREGWTVEGRHVVVGG